ncbi:MAG: hypothetical protein E7642_01965 [Ruminococcaceae bacterium]|nr:hypothetical protein [Oscillospiraceae bacterium]
MSDKSTLVLIGEDAPSSALKALAQKGFEVFLLKRDPRLALPVSSHADMLLFCTDGKLFLTKEYADSFPQLTDILCEYGYEIHLSHNSPKNEYPHDILFNIALIKKEVFGNIPYIDSSVKSYLSKSGYTLRSVKQGYAKCSSAIIGDKALITADKTIETAARALGIDVLRISNSSAIRLNGYDHGFIGGACGYFDGTLYFCGDITLHPEYQAISDFCKRHSTVLCSLSNEPLYDVGSIFFLEKKK